MIHPYANREVSIEQVDNIGAAAAILRDGEDLIAQMDNETGLPLPQQRLRQLGRDAIFLGMIDGLRQHMTETDIKILQDREENASGTEHLEHLQQLREKLVEAGVRTDDIDTSIQQQALDNELTQPTTDERLVMNYCRTFLQSTATPETSVTLPMTYETTAPSTSEAVLEGTLDVGFIATGNDAFIQIGAAATNRIQITGKESHRNQYPLEQFAAVAALCELVPGEYMKVSQLKSHMQSILQQETPISNDSLRAVRICIDKLRYDGQPVFLSNGKRGAGSAYGINPDLTLDPTLVFETYEDRNQFFVQLFQSHDSANTAQPVTTEPISTVHEAAIRALLPSTTELQTFCYVVQNVVTNTNELRQVDLDEHPVTEQFFTVTGEILSLIQQGYDANDLAEAIEDTIETRKEVIAQFITLAEDDEQLNQFLELPEHTLIDEYGPDITPKVHQMIEMILDMNHDEKQLLRNIAEAQITTEYSYTYDRRRTGGTAITDIRTSSRPIDVPASLRISPETYLAMSREERAKSDVTIFIAEEVIAINPSGTDSANEDDHETVLPSPTELTATPVDRLSEVAVENDSYRNDNRDEIAKQAKMAAGLAITQLTSSGITPNNGRRYNSANLAQFGINSKALRNAAENNIISESTSKRGVSFSDIVTMLVLRDLGKPGTVPHLRKVIRKTVQAAVAAFEADS